VTFGTATYGLGLVAGALSTLSPCVLPLVPVLIASAVNAHRWGAVALGTGLVLSFAIIGIFLATVGASLGLDPDTFRTAGAVVLAIFGAILLVPKLQETFASASGALSNSGNELLARVTFEGLTGQFLIGLLLGVVWSPCVGPTLAQPRRWRVRAETWGQIGFANADFRHRSRGAIGASWIFVPCQADESACRLLNAGKVGKQVLGLVMLGTGHLIAAGLDKSLEAWFLDRTPDWLTTVTTRF